MAEKEKKQKKASNSDNKARNAFSFIFLVSVVLIIAFLTVLSVLKSGQFDFDNIRSVLSLITNDNQETSGDNVTPISTVISGGSAYAYVPCGRYLYVSNGQDITVYDASGQAVHKEIIEIKNPVTAYNAEIALIGDRDEKIVYIYKGLKRIAYLELTGAIRYMTVNNDGYISVLCDDTDAYSKISYYDPAGKKICDISKWESVAVNSVVLSSNKEYMINSVKISGTGFESNLEFADFLAQAADAGHITQNTLFSVLLPLNQSAILAGNEEGIYCYDRNASLLWKVQPGKVIGAALVKNGIVYAYYNNKGSCTVVFSDQNGNTLNEYTFGSNIVNIRTYDDIAAINYGREVLFFNSAGTLLKGYSSKSDILDIYPLGRTHAVSITEIDLTFMKLY